MGREEWWREAAILGLRCLYIIAKGVNNEHEDFKSKGPGHPYNSLYTLIGNHIKLKERASNGKK